MGDFYDQYGSGLIFRAYEDRALGVNTSVEGVRAGMNIGDAFAIRAMLGRPRLYMEYAPSWLRGADATLALSSLFGFKSQYLALEGSYLSQYDQARLNIVNNEGQSILSSDMSAWSARMVYEAAGFSGRLELVGKSPGAYLQDGENVAYKGRAQLIELGYSGYGWGISLTGRNVDHMEMKLTDSNELQYSGTGNVLNYIPALTRQYTYSLANLDPFQVKAKGERSGQLDVYYNIHRGSKARWQVRYETACQCLGRIPAFGCILCAGSSGGCSGDEFRIPRYEFRFREAVEQEGENHVPVRFPADDGGRTDDHSHEQVRIRIRRTLQVRYAAFAAVRTAISVCAVRV